MPVQAKRRAEAGPELSPSRAMPAHKRITVDTTAIMRYVIQTTAQQDVNLSIGGLRDGLTVAVQKIEELGEAVNDHANRFATHHEGVS